VCVCVCVCARVRVHHHNNLSCHVCGLDEGNRISGGCDCRISQSSHE